MEPFSQRLSLDWNIHRAQPPQAFRRQEQGCPVAPRAVPGFSQDKLAGRENPVPASGPGGRRGLLTGCGLFSGPQALGMACRGGGRGIGGVQP